MRCKKFNAKQKLKILEQWDGTELGARRVARNNLCSVSSIWKWSATYKAHGVEGLGNKSSRPHNYRNPHTIEEDALIESTLLEFPGICRQELYYRLRVEKSYTRSIRTMFKALRNIKTIPAAKVQLQKTSLHVTTTPPMPGMRWQIDVKYVPYNSISASLHQQYKSKRAKLYQYTCIDECTRERFLWITDTHCANESVRFMKRCMLYFGYKPLQVQTDNGTEFSSIKENKKNIHFFTSFLNSQEIKHQQTDPHCPWQNGKVERSHRTDNIGFYKYNIFASLADARKKSKDWLIRYNTMRPSPVLDNKTPVQLREQLLAQIDIGEYDICRVEFNRDKAFAA